MKNLLRVACCLGALAGCASRAPFTDAPAPPPGKALVYIYRTYNYQQGNQGASIFLDSKQVVNLANRAYTWVYVPEGMHTLEHRKQVFTAEERTGGPVRLTAGRTHYFRVGVSLASGIKDVRWMLSEEPVMKARDELAECHYQPAKGAGSQ